MTFRLAEGRLAQQTYWSWDEIAPIAGNNPRELADELGTRFRTAVERRTTRQTGLTLSGGLDSRAILAAMPHAPKTFTFGRPNSADVRLAALVPLPIDYANWSRRAPGKTLCDHLLNDATADLWHRHLAGEDHTAILGRHLTLKLYFRQLFDNKYRTLEEAEELLNGT